MLIWTSSMEEDLDLMHKVLPDPESQGYANIVNTGPWCKNAKQPGADASVRLSANAGKTSSITRFTPNRSLSNTFQPPRLAERARMTAVMLENTVKYLRDFLSTVFRARTSLVATLNILDYFLLDHVTGSHPSIFMLKWHFKCGSVCL